jgi:hypothetical protein
MPSVTSVSGNFYFIRLFMHLNLLIPSPIKCNCQVPTRFVLERKQKRLIKVLFIPYLFHLCTSKLEFLVYKFITISLIFVIMGDEFYHICSIEEAVLGFVVVVTSDAYSMLFFRSWYWRTNVKYKTEQDSSINGKKVTLFA